MDPKERIQDKEQEEDGYVVEGTLALLVPLILLGACGLLGWLWWDYARTFSLGFASWPLTLMAIFATLVVVSLLAGLVYLLSVNRRRIALALLSPRTGKIRVHFGPIRAIISWVDAMGYITATMLRANDSR